MRPPFPYYGGKHYLLKTLLAHIPPHHTYVEVFGGAAHLLLAKPPSPVEVYNDLHSGVTNFYRVVRERPEELAGRLLWTPYGREEYEDCRGTWEEETDLLEKARRWFVAQRMAFGGVQTLTSGWSYSVSQSRRGMSGTVSKYLSSIDGFLLLAERLRTVQIEHKDFADILHRYDTPDTFFYCDPPYVLAAREGGTGYHHEFTLDDHQRLLQVIVKVQGKVLLSGYTHPLYEETLQGWSSCTTAMRQNACQHDQRLVAKREEVLWWNYILEDI